MPELRKDPVVGRWVIIATDRARRPSDWNGSSPPQTSRESCPFCPGNERFTPGEERVSDDSELIEEFWQAFAANALCNLHILVHYGRNSHHISEAMFKAAARARRSRWTRRC